MRYIMVTDFTNHWDNIKGNLTSYPPKMVKKIKPDKAVTTKTVRTALDTTRLKNGNDNLESGIETIFIKKYNGSTDVEKAWSGKVYDIQKIPGSIFFRVEIEKEIDCPVEYADYENGWYVEK